MSTHYKFKPPIVSTRPATTIVPVVPVCVWVCECVYVLVDVVQYAAKWQSRVCGVHDSNKMLACGTVVECGPGFRQPTHIMITNYSYGGQESAAECARSARECCFASYLLRTIIQYVRGAPVHSCTTRRQQRICTRAMYALKHEYIATLVYHPV